MSNLPVGWGSRNNQMSEHDIKLGGIAATKFATKQNSAYEDDVSGVYKSSDDVRQFYLQQQSTNDQSSTPDFWQERQKTKELQAQQFGVFSSKPTMMRS